MGQAYFAPVFFPGITRKSGRCVSGQRPVLQVSYQLPVEADNTSHAFYRYTLVIAMNFVHIDGFQAVRREPEDIAADAFILDGIRAAEHDVRCRQRIGKDLVDGSFNGFECT